MGIRQAEVLFLDFVKWGFDERGWSRRTRSEYRYVVRAADSWLRANTPRTLFSANQKALRAYLFQTRPSARNRNHIRQALVGFFDFLVDNNFRDDNPARGLPRLPQAKSLPKALSPEQAHAALRAARAMGPMEEALIAVLLYTGMRRGEARKLPWSAVDGEWIRFQSTKSRREREIPLHPNASRALNKWRALCREATYVFPSRVHPERPMSETALGVLVHNVGELAGVHLHPHICRHTCATTLLEAGVDLRTIQEWLGHASPTTTAIYTRVRPARLKEAVEKLDYP